MGDQGDAAIDCFIPVPQCPRLTTLSSPHVQRLSRVNVDVFEHHVAVEREREHERAGHI